MAKVPGPVFAVTSAMRNSFMQQFSNLGSRGPGGDGATGGGATGGGGVTGGVGVTGGGAASTSAAGVPAGTSTAPGSGFLGLT